MNLQMTQTRSKLDGRVRITQSGAIQRIINLKFGWLWPKTPKAEVQNWANSFMGFCYPKTPGTSVWQRPKGQGLPRSETEMWVLPLQHWCGHICWPELGPEWYNARRDLDDLGTTPSGGKAFPVESQIEGSKLLGPSKDHLNVLNRRPTVYNPNAIKSFLSERTHLW